MASPSLFPYLLIAVLTFLVYSNSLNCDFTFDDNSAVVLNRHVHTNETDWWSVFEVDYWGTPIQLEHSHKSYRPLTLLTFRINHLISGLDPFGYHLTNVALHIFASVICYDFFLNILNHDVPSALFSSLFFALHPLKSEAVSGIVGRAELLSTLFFMVSLFCYFGSSFGRFSFYAILATLSKEQGFTIPCICIVLELVEMFKHFHRIKMCSILDQAVKLAKHSSFIRIIFFTLFFVIIGTFRFYIMGCSLPVFTKFDNPASFEDTPIRQLTYNYLLSLNAKLMLYPDLLCADWTMNSIPLVCDIYDPRNIWTVIFYVVTLILLVRALVDVKSCANAGPGYNDKIVLTLALSLTIIPFIPASNLLFPVGFVIAERILYMPSIGYSLILAIGFNKFRKCLKSKLAMFVLYFCALLTVASLGARTYIRNFDWSNDLTLFESGLKVNPNNSKLYNNIGHFYERNRQYNEAMEFFKKAANTDSEDIGSELNIARTMINLNLINEAEQLLWNIKPKVRNSAIRNRIVPSYLNIWIDLAHVISRNNSRLDEAEKLYREVIAIRRDFVDAYINLGEIFIRRLEYDQAIDIYQQALLHIKSHNDLKASDLYYNIAIAQTLQMGHDSMRLDDYDQNAILAEITNNFVSAIDINHNHKEALINLALLVQKPNFPNANRTYYREYVLKALQLYSKNEEQEVIEFNIAITLLDLGGPNNRLEAIGHFKRAVMIKPDFRSALYNLALLYYDFKDYGDSLFYLNQISVHHPNYTKAFLLMADIYSRLGNLNLTEQTYLKVLESDADNYEALHNLCLIYKKNQRPKQAKYCEARLNNSNRTM